MAAWKRKGRLQKYYDRFVNGMLVRGYDRTFADGISQQILRFSFAMRLARNPRVSNRPFGQMRHTKLHARAFLVSLGMSDGGAFPAGPA
jgi:hypothetical protein